MCTTRHINTTTPNQKQQIDSGFLINHGNYEHSSFTYSPRDQLRIISVMVRCLERLVCSTHSHRSSLDFHKMTSNSCCAVAPPRSCWQHSSKGVRGRRLFCCSPFRLPDRRQKLWGTRDRTPRYRRPLHPLTSLQPTPRTVTSNSMTHCLLQYCLLQLQDTF